MYVKNLSLQYFRNYENLNISLSPKLNILYGDNAQGKTNILEAIYICSMGRSQKTQKDKEIIKIDKKEAHIRAYVVSEISENRIDVNLKKEVKKGIAINGIILKSLNELFGTVYVVIFSPEDLQLIKSSPSERRKFMDMEICQLSSLYYYDLKQYYKVLKQRNNLLRSSQKNPTMRDTVFVWDNQLISYGKKIMNARVEFINKINTISSKIHSNITGGEEAMTIKYIPNIPSNEFEQKLKTCLDKDVILGSTSVGPHKDDLQFFINGNDARIYGSQGQQRTTALAIKLAEIELIKEETLCSPVLLLDDVLSELDKNRQAYFLESINNIQTILTCTGIEDSIRSYTNKAQIYKIKTGNAFSVT